MTHDRLFASDISGKAQASQWIRSFVFPIHNLQIYLGRQVSRLSGLLPPLMTVSTHGFLQVSRMEAVEARLMEFQDRYQADSWPCIGKRQGSEGREKKKNPRFLRPALNLFPPNSALSE